MVTITWIISYLVAVNLIGFLVMGMDKARAKKHAWRIPESALFFVAIIFGSLGSIVGMYVFRHKTRHKAFKWGMPIILIIQIALVMFLILYPGLNIEIM